MHARILGWYDPTGGARSRWRHAAFAGNGMGRRDRPRRNPQGDLGSLARWRWGNVETKCRTDDLRGTGDSWSLFKSVPVPNLAEEHRQRADMSPRWASDIHPNWKSLSILLDWRLRGGNCGAKISGRGAAWEVGKVYTWCSMPIRASVHGCYLSNRMNTLQNKGSAALALRRISMNGASNSVTPQLMQPRLSWPAVKR